MRGANPSYGGTGAPTDSGYTAIYSTERAFAAVKSDGSITAWGNASYGGTGAPTDSGYTAIYSTDRAFAALKSDGSVTVWGNDTAGGGADAPSGAQNSDFIHVYATKYAFAALKADGSITAWGDTLYGGSNAPSDNTYTQIYSTGYAFAALKSDGSITAWGNPSYGGTGAPTDGGYIEIYSTGYAFAALKADGSITAWGDSTSGGSNAPTGVGYTIPYGLSCFNVPPTDIALTPSNIDENVAPGTTIGMLTTEDSDTTDVHTYSFTTGCINTGVDNDAFTITNDHISINTSPDYEVQDTYNVCVTTNDGSDTFEKEFVITINDLNTAPTDITLSNGTIEEKQVVGTTVGTLTTVDDGEQSPESYTFSIGCTTPGVDDGHFTLNGNQLQSNTFFDYTNPVDDDADNNYEICIRTTETNGGLFYDKNITITVTDDGNNVPTDITLSPNSIDENVANDTTVGALTTTDPDTADTHTYTFTTGCANNGVDNTNFTITGDQISINTAPDYETQDTYNLCITTDDGINTYEKEIVVHINDLDEQQPPQNPVIALVGSATMEITQNTTFTDPGATANDPQDGDITDQIIVAGVVDTTTIDTYTITYTVTDSENNTTTVTRIVRVVEPNNDDESDLEKPRSLTIHCSSKDSTALITWKDDSHNEEGYKIQRKMDNGSWKTIKKIETKNRKNWTDTNLENGHTYAYRVRVYDGSDHTKWSKAVQCTLHKNNTQYPVIATAPKEKPAVTKKHNEPEKLPQDNTQDHAKDTVEKTAPVQSLQAASQEDVCTNWHWSVWIVCIIIIFLCVMLIDSSLALTTSFIPIVLWYIFDTCHTALWVPIAIITVTIVGKLIQMLYAFVIKE